MSKRFLLIVMLILGSSMVACTTGRSQRYPRYPNYPPYPSGQGYPNYPGYPQRNGLEQIQALADHLKDVTAEAAEEAKELEQTSDHQAVMIERLDDLQQESKDFRESINQVNDSFRDQGYGDPYGYQRNQQDPANSRAQFTEVLQKYYSARKVLLESPREDEVQKDFERVTSIMRNLTRFYGYRFEPDYEYSEPTIQ